MRFILGLFLMFGLSNLSFAENPLALSSTSVGVHAALPALYTCDGKGLNPQIAWSGASPKTSAFVLILSDPDAPSATFYHWVLYNLPKNTSIISEGTGSLPAGTLVGKNSAGSYGYKPPCPPKGTNHRYVFDLYALDMSLTIAGGADAATVLKAIENHVLQTGSYSMTYGH